MSYGTTILDGILPRSQVEVSTRTNIRFLGSRRPRSKAGCWCSLVGFEQWFQNWGYLPSKKVTWIPIVFVTHCFPELRKLWIAICKLLDQSQWNFAQTRFVKFSYLAIFWSKEDLDSSSIKFLRQADSYVIYAFFEHKLNPRFHRYFENIGKVNLSNFLEPLHRRRCCFTLRNFSQTTACFPCKRSVMPHTKIRKDPKKKHFRPWRSPIIKAKVDYRGMHRLWFLLSWKNIIKFLVNKAMIFFI